MKKRIFALALTMLAISASVSVTSFANSVPYKAPGDAETYVIFGSDNRVKVSDTSAKGSNAICNLTITFVHPKTGAKKTVYGTGFMYSDLTMGTAGHCIYDLTYDTKAQRIKIVPGDSPSGGLDSVTIENKNNMHVLSEFENTHNWVYDYGCVTLDEPFSSDVEPMSLNPDLTSSQYKSKYLTLSGYDRKSAQLYKQRSNSLVTEVTTKDFSFKYDTLSGMSGSPIYTDDYEVVGIYNYGPNGVAGDYVDEDYSDGYNSAQRMNDACYDFLMSFVE